MNNIINLNMKSIQQRDYMKGDRFDFSPVTQVERKWAYNHAGMMLWLTGVSGAGKSALAVALERALFEKGLHTLIIDSDTVKNGLCRDLADTPQQHSESVRRISEVARLAMMSGLIVIVAAASPFRVDRDRVRESVAVGEFIEVYCDHPAANHRESQHTDAVNGIAVYEKSEQPDVQLNTVEQPLHVCVEKVIEYLGLA